MVSRMSLLIQVHAHTTVMSRVISKIILCRSHSLSSLQSRPLCWERRARGAFSSANHKLWWTRPPWESRNHVVTQGPRKDSLFPKRVLFAGSWPPLWPSELGWEHFTLHLGEASLFSLSGGHGLLREWISLLPAVRSACKETPGLIMPLPWNNGCPLINICVDGE